MIYKPKEPNINKDDNLNIETTENTVPFIPVEQIKTQNEPKETEEEKKQREEKEKKNYMMQKDGKKRKKRK